MAGRSPRTGEGSHTPRHDPRTAPEDDTPPEPVLIRVQDLAGRPRGTGFLADHHGTVITSHEAVDGLARLVLYGAGDRGCVVTADAVTPLPELDLALVRTQGLDADPLPVTVREGVGSGTYVRLPAGCWREARVLTTTSVTYTATSRFHCLADCLELAIGTAGRDALWLGGGAAGGPVLDAETGAVVAVLGTALRSDHHDSGFAVPLRPGPPGGPLADLLARNAATVPAYGADLNLAGLLELAATSVGSDGPPADSRTLVERAVPAQEFAAFAESPAAVLGLVGAPGSGRTTELAALAERRARGAAPTLWLRGADLREADDSVADAARRALGRAVRIVAASRPVPALDDLTPERLAHHARAAGARCCSSSTAPRRCRPSSPTASPSGPRARPSGCGRREPGWWWPAGRSTGSRPARTSRRACCTAVRTGTCRPASPSVISPRPRPARPVASSASRTPPSRAATPGIRSPSGCTRRSAPPSPTPTTARPPAATTSSPPTST